MAAAWACTDFGSNAIPVMTDSATAILMLRVICVTRLPGCGDLFEVQCFSIRSRGDGEKFHLPALKSFAAVLMTEREDQLNELMGIRSRLTGSGNSAPETRTAEPPAVSISTSAQSGSGSDEAMIDQFVRRHRAAIPGSSGGN